MWDLNADPGEGSLNARAYVASIVGPKRATHGQRAIRRVPANNTELLAKNSGKPPAVVYVEVWLPRQYVGAGLRLLFSSSSDAGESGNLVTLVAFPGEMDRYRAILLTNEELYAQVVSDAAGNAVASPVSVVVSTVTF